MGISGLLPFLSPHHRKVNISQYHGKCVAIDTYCWLHRGAFSCAFELATGAPTQRYVNYVVKRIKLLQHHKILPIMVFDGCNAPMKKGTDDKRRETKKINREKGRQLLSQGNKSGAVEMFQKSVNVTGEMALEVIKECYAMNVPVIVAPYEADAQLTHLVNTNIVDLVITEDSDLVVFGCQRVLFKMDDNGDGVEIRLSDIGTSTEAPRLDGWTHDKFRQMCVMSGCDYLDRLPLCGLKTVHKQFRKFVDVERGIKALIAEKNMKKASNAIDPNYYEKFLRANLAFKHHFVFDPVKGQMSPLNPLPPHATLQDMPFLGKVLSDVEVTEIACGNTNPNNGQKVASFSPNYSSLAPRCDKWRESKGAKDVVVQKDPSDSPITFGANTSNSEVKKSIQVPSETKRYFSTKRSNDYILETVQINGNEALAKIYGSGKRRKMIPQTTTQQSRFFANPQNNNNNPFAINKPPPPEIDSSPEKENSPEGVKFPIQTGPDKSENIFKSIMKPSNVLYSSAIRYEQFLDVHKQDKEEREDKEILTKLPTPNNHHSVKIGLSKKVQHKPAQSSVFASQSKKMDSMPVTAKPSVFASQSKKVDSMPVTAKPSAWINTDTIRKKKVIDLGKASPKSQPTLRFFMKSSQKTNDSNDKTKSKYF